MVIVRQKLLLSDQQSQIPKVSERQQTARGQMTTGDDSAVDEQLFHPHDQVDSSTATDIGHSFDIATISPFRTK
ncbi:MAG: hypothetical protein Q9208_004156 [Pyrenodesmia sp. 3 TL-2023]